jgi:hypothetical protein
MSALVKVVIQPVLIKTDLSADALDEGSFDQ